jgi:two-component system OmpR family response regulator
VSERQAPGDTVAPADAPVLVVDDDPTIRQLLRWALEDEGIAVETAADGWQALSYIARRRPALVVLDMGLPGADGYQVADSLRAAHGPNVPIVVITADGRAATKAAGVGAFAYFHKPFELGDLVATVQRGLAAG